MHRLALRLPMGVLFVALAAGTAVAGPTTYDISSIIFEKHPFAASGPLPPVIAAPVPPGQIRAPARVPQPTSPSRTIIRPAAEPTAADRVPAATAQSLSQTPSPTPNEELRSILSEIRIGLLAHDYGPFSSHEESGVDGNFELLFVSPSFLDVIWSPRPHIGFSVNSAGDTSQVYAGLSWEWSFWRNWFAGFSLGGSLHDGETETDRVDRKELGCHLLFRESVEIGYRFGGRHALSAFLDHISNAKLCDKNEGLETTGIRYGYRF